VFGQGGGMVTTPAQKRSPSIWPSLWVADLSLNFLATPSLVPVRTFPFLIAPKDRGTTTISPQTPSPR